VWTLRAERDGDVREERVDRQGTAYRRARRLYAAGYQVSAVQFTVDGEPDSVYRFDGIRFVPVPALRRR
jgi:hypothetical protein